MTDDTPDAPDGPDDPDDPDADSQRSGDQGSSDQASNRQGAGDDPRRDAGGDHAFSEGQGFDDPYDEFDIDPPSLDVDPDKVDPVDSRVVTDLLDDEHTRLENVDANELVDVGLNYVAINRYEQATDTFERAAQYADDDHLEQEAWVNKGAAHAELEEYDAAIGAYRDAIDIDPESEHAASAETNLAFALWESGDVSRALEHAERAVEIDERFAQGWYNRGFFLLERGLAEDALHAFDNAIRLGMRNSKILEEKARAHEELGEDERAEEIAEEAEELREHAESELVDDHAQGDPITDLHGDDPRPDSHQHGDGRQRGGDRQPGDGGQRGADRGDTNANPRDRQHDGGPR
jgi:tetratricopeptide (TPR) repeat protein